MVGSFKSPSIAPFPSEEIRRSVRRYLRRQFAGMAMQGICAHPETWGQNCEGIAKHAVQCADALLAELDKESAHEMD